MYSKIKIFRRFEGQSSTEPMSLNDHDRVINHNSYDDLVEKIRELALENEMKVTITCIWQKQYGETFEITADNHSQIMPDIKICVLFTSSGSSNQADASTLMKHLEERIAILERRERDADKLARLAQKYANSKQIGR